MILGILLLALILRLINLNQSLWLDEAVQAITAQKSFFYIFEELRGDFHPPLYHILMHFWIRFFGGSEISLRIPSVLFGIGTVFIVYLITKELFREKLIQLTISNQQLAIISALFMATAPFHIYYSQEARMYSASCFLVSASFYYFVRVLKDDRGWLRDRKGIGYFIFTLMALYTDYYAVLVVLAQIIAGIIILRKREIVKLLNCHLALLLFSPIFPLLISQIKNGMMATQNLPKWSKLVNLSFFKALPLTFIKFSIGRITIFNKNLYAYTVAMLFLVYGLIIFKGFLKDKKLTINKPASRNSSGMQQLTIILWFLVPLTISWLGSLFIPNYQPFHLLLVLPAFYLLLIYGISASKTSMIYIIEVAFILTVNLISFFVYYKNPYFWREDWRGLAKMVKQENVPIIISSQTSDWPLVYYGVKDQTIGILPGVGMINQYNQSLLLVKVSDREKIFYTPYLADLYDPQKLVPKWLGELNFVKIREVGFNQVPVWEYELKD